MDQIDVALEDSAAPMASWSGAIFCRRAPQCVERPGGVRVLLVALVDEEARGRWSPAERDGVLEAGLHATVASITRIAPSVAVKPEITSAVKSG